MNIVLISIFSFLLGSIPFGVVIAKTKGINLREVGSGNIGATNVLRAVGKKAAIFTLLGDILKGTAAVAIGIYLGYNDLIVGLFGICALLGHDFSIFMKFKGGKGVATALGVIFMYSPFVGLITVLIWIITAYLLRYSSLSALAAFFLLPLNVYLLDYNETKLMISLTITLLIFVKHRDNIKRLVQGTESKIGKRS